MGFLKKIFKPVSKVLDKIVPNEIKPFLPYAAAFAPMLMPAAASGSFLSSMLGRGLMSGGLNIGAQLAQEGNEGDINKLSALLSGGIGALSAPTAGQTLRGYDGIGSEGIMGKGANFFAEGADKLQSINAAGAKAPFSMDGLKAAVIPFAQGTGDAMYNEAKVAERDYERALREYEAEQEALGTASDAGRRQAIIAAMTGNHTQEVIDETLAELGLRDGGRVAYNMGGRVGFAERGFVGELRDNSENMIGEIAKVMFRLTPPGMMMFGMDKATELYNDLDEDGKGKVKEYAMDFGLRMASPPLAIGKGIYDYFSEDKEEKAMGGRVGRAYGGGFGGIEAAVQTVKDRDLKENLTIAKDTEMDMKSLAEEFLATYKRQPNSYDELMEFYKKKNGYEAGGEEVVEEQVINAANGGIMGARVPFVSGGGVRGLINAARSSDIGADMARAANSFDEVPVGLVDEMGETLTFKPGSASGAIDEVIDVAKVTEEIPRGPVGPGMLDKMAAGNPQMQAAKEFIESIRGVDGGIDYALAEAQIGRGIKLKGNETIEELIELFLFKPNKKAIAAIGAGYGGLGAGAMMNDTSIQAANGGIMNYNMGGSVLPNGVEMDYRGGGFIPMGSKERADDVPARVSKNEFVMTADAVRAAGGGSVNKGAKKMYELMNNLEARA